MLPPSLLTQPTADLLKTVVRNSGAGQGKFCVRLEELLNRRSLYIEAVQTLILTRVVQTQAFWVKEQQNCAHIVSKPSH